MKNEIESLPALLTDCNGHAVRVGLRTPTRRFAQLGDAVRRLEDNKVYRVASLHGGLVTFTNANGSRPRFGEWCKEEDFASRYVFDCAAW